MKALIFQARDYQFVGKTGEQIRSNEVWLLENQEPLSTGRFKGVAILSLKASEETIGTIMSASLPAVFDVDFGRRPGFKGQVDTFISSAKFVKAVKVSDLVG